MQNLTSSNIQVNSFTTERVIRESNDQAERQAEKATQPENSATKSPKTVNLQAGGQFAPVPLLGVSLSYSKRDKTADFSIFSGEGNGDSISLKKSDLITLNQAIINAILHLESEQLCDVCS